MGEVKDKTNKKVKKEKKGVSLFEKLFKKSLLKKPDKVAVIYLRNNGIAEPMEVTSKKGFFTINNRTYHEKRDCIYTVTKERIPLAIIKEWDIFPIGTKKWDDEPMREKFSELEDHALRGIRYAELVKMGDHDRPKLNYKTMILIALGIIIVLAIAIGYGS